MCTDFEYANLRLSDFGCIMCHVNTSSGFMEVDIGCDITINTVKNNQSSIHSITSSTYDNVYSVSFDIIKDRCVYGDDIYMNSLEVRNLTKWLNRKDYHKFRALSDITDESDVNYYGSFNVKQIMYGNSILGLSVTFTANAPYGLGSLIEMKFYIDEVNNTFVINGDGDDYGIIYPTVLIKSLEMQDITIVNQTTESTMTLKNCMTNETIKINGQYKLITSSDASHVTLANDFNYEYLDILIDEFDTANSYTVNGKCEIIISYYPVRKVGAY